MNECITTQEDTPKKVLEERLLRLSSIVDGFNANNSRLSLSLDNLSGLVPGDEACEVSNEPTSLIDRFDKLLDKLSRDQSELSSEISRLEQIC